MLLTTRYIELIDARLKSRTSRAFPELLSGIIEWVTVPLR